MKKKFLAYLSLYMDLPDSDAQLILDTWEEKDYPEGSVLFPGNSVCRQLFFVCDGVVRILSDNEKGVEVTHYFLKENQFCTILNSFNNNMVAHERIQAACKVEALEISRPALNGLFQQLPWLQPLIDRITRQALLDKIEIRNAYLGLDAASRYRLFMIRQPDIALRVPLSDIASYLGITPQSLSRIRKNLSWNQ